MCTHLFVLPLTLLSLSCLCPHPPTPPHPFLCSLQVYTNERRSFGIACDEVREQSESLSIVLLQGVLRMAMDHHRLLLMDFLSVLMCACVRAHVPSSTHRHRA